MKKERKMEFKKGAASFYIVAFSSLILTVIAMSFAAIIVSEITRTSNDDLAQSAYDSALAGIEDAKVAYYNYLTCKEDGSLGGVSAGSGVTCDDIINWVETNPDCYNVGHIIGKIKKGEEGEVFITETSVGDKSMQQAYTCNKINILLSDYRGTLSESSPTKVVQAKFGNNNTADDIDTVKVSWYSHTDGSEYQFTNYNFVENGTSSVTFPIALASKLSTPPTISVGIVQTSTKFKLDDFDRAEREKVRRDDGRKEKIWRTNRGMVYLVPMDETKAASGENLPDNYIGAYNQESNKNIITARQIVKSNDQTVKNLPYGVYCDGGSGKEFACSAEIELPRPIRATDGLTDTRNDETFMIVVSIPYGLPSTDFALEFCGKGGCEKKDVEGNYTPNVDSDGMMVLSGVQVDVDSTGRASDLYRRVEARMDVSDNYYPYPLYAIELLGKDSNNTSLKKVFTVDCEAQRWDAGNGNLYYNTCTDDTPAPEAYSEYNWVDYYLTLQYDNNGGSGSVASESTEDGYDIIVRNQGNMTKAGYSFSGWNTDPNGNGTAYSPGDEIIADITADQTITLYAQWDEIKYYMQEMNDTICSELAGTNDKRVYDRRDEKAYTVRYINGRCWMTSNLDLDGGTTLTSRYSNVSSSYTLPESSTDNFRYNCSGLSDETQRMKCEGQLKQYGYNPNSAYLFQDFRDYLRVNAGVYNGDTDTCTYYHNCGSSYYNYVAATVGNSDSYDICPARWRLPKASDINSQFVNSSLLNALRNQNVGYYTHGGYFRNDGYIYYWLLGRKYVYPIYHGEVLTVQSNYIHHNYSFSSEYGLPVRCVMK